MKRAILFHLFFIGLSSIAYTQVPTQTISGQVVDKETQEPLIGASVSIKDLQPALGAITDIEGKFSLKNVPVGRLQVQCSYVGYEPWLSDPIIVNSARAAFLTIAVSEGATNNMKEVVVSARKRGNEPINELSLLSTRSFSVDETQRYAASANDPSRMAMGFPGVQPSRDSRSDIVVRGNSGIGLLWRLEGIDIPNPNHFARRGSSGGGITVFSVSMLANSDFSTGAFPAEYGNAYSGVFDIHFRKGNPEKRQYTFRAGMLGLDFSTEGPIKKNSGASYLVNYRYSTLGILNKMGLHLVGARIDNTFQDLSFNLYLPGKHKKHIFTVWGIGGLSQEVENAVKDPAEWKSFDDYYTRDFDTNMGALGATHTVLLSGDAYVKTSIAAMSQDIYWRNDTLSPEKRPFAVNTEQYRETRFVLNSFLSKKFSRKLSLKTGITLTQMPYYLRRATLQDSTSIDARGATQMVQPYANLRIRPTDRLTFNAGIHILYFALNQTSSVEPRLGARFQLTEKQSISLAWGIHGRVLPLGNYFTRINGVEVNHNIDLIRAQHYVAGWDLLPGKSMRIHAEAYFQKMKDVPVARDLSSSWSILNTVSGFTNLAMVNAGTGENIGLDMSFEKSFDKGAFFLLSGSLSRSRYTDAAGREHLTAFDSGVSGTFMGGKEWSFKNASVFQIGLKLLYNGGQRLTPLRANQTVSRYIQEPLLDDSKAFTERVDAYFRPDMRLAFRKNNPKSAWSLALDIQNLIGRKNVDPLSRDYDPDLNQWVYREQSGLTPVLSFQIDL